MRAARRAACAILLLSAAAALAHARAGGGQSYSGGGFSSGGGYSSGGNYSGGGGDAFNLAFNLWFLWVESEPLIAIPVTLLVLWLVLRHFQLAGTPGSGYEIPEGLDVQDGMRRQAALANLASRDPDFVLAAFLERTKAAFLKVQQAWSGQDMGPARLFVSDGVFERFSIQLELQKSDRIENRMEQVSVLSADLVQLESEDDFDAAHVAIVAQAVDSDVSLDDGRVVRLGSLRPFEEVWTFLRKRGARSLKGPGLIEGFCPGCGAAFEHTDAARCPSCKIWVQSGEYDWVLCEITQACEWGAREAGRDVPGWKALEGADPDINPQFLEDRASVAFWRWQSALSRGDASPVRGIADDAWKGEVERETKGRPFSYRDVGVGRVAVVGAELGPPSDRAHLAVKWSGCRYEGRTRAGSAVHTDIFTLERRTGAKTSIQSGLRSAACPNCGAPAGSRDEESCAFCGTSFNDGSRSWVVAARVPASDWKPPSIEAAPAPDWSSPFSPYEGLTILVWGMLADGVINEKELDFLESYRAKNDIPKLEVEQVLEAGRAGRLQLPHPKTPEQASAALRGLIRMALSDGEMDAAELQAISAYGAQFGLSADDVRQMAQEEKVAMFEHAKETLSAGH